MGGRLPRFMILYSDIGGRQVMSYMGDMGHGASSRGQALGRGCLGDPHATQAAHRALGTDSAPRSPCGNLGALRWVTGHGVRVRTNRVRSRLTQTR